MPQKLTAELWSSVDSVCWKVIPRVIHLWKVETVAGGATGEACCCSGGSYNCTSYALLAWLRCPPTLSPRLYRLHQRASALRLLFYTVSTTSAGSLYSPSMLVSDEARGRACATELHRSSPAHPRSPAVASR